MVAVNRDQSADKPASGSGSGASTPVVSTGPPEASSEEGACSKKEEQSVEEKETASEAKGDPEMAPIYLQRLLPVFTQVYQSTMLPSVRLVYPSYVLKNLADFYQDGFATKSSRNHSAHNICLRH